MGLSLESINGVVEEIMRIHRFLPPRPSIEEVQVAAALAHNVDREVQIRIDALSKQKKGIQVPDELFSVLQVMQKNLVHFQCKEQKREAMKLLDLENAHFLFDELIQRASRCLHSTSEGPVTSILMSSSSVSSTSLDSFDAKENFTSSSFVNHVVVPSSGNQITRDDSFVRKVNLMYTDEPRVGINVSEGLLLNSAPSSRSTAISGDDCEKLSLIRLASLIEITAKKGTQDLNLQNKLLDRIDWIPDSIGKLTGLATLDLSENRIFALPTTIGALTSLTKLDLHFNQISELPDSIGDLFSLLYLNLGGNLLVSLPSTIGKLHRLEELDVSSNQLSLLPDAVGNLHNLKKLDVETNNIEEFPYTIGNCISLVEIRADYNRLKALPEAIGKLGSLQVLKVRYNNIKGLPSTMASLSKLKEIDASFNELESIPESLCLVTSLTKLNIGNNFANLQFLPRSIGNLEMLEELDMSNNQIRILPDSFRMLSHLHVLHAEENPLEIPTRQIAEKGAQVVVQYMAELVSQRDVKSQAAKNEKIWASCCFFSTLTSKQKSDGRNYVT